MIFEDINSYLYDQCWCYAHDTLLRYGRSDLIAKLIDDCGHHVDYVTDLNDTDLIGTYADYLFDSGLMTV